MKNVYNNLNEENSDKDIELPRLKLTDINFDSLPKINEKLIEVDYLERSSGSGCFKSIFNHMKSFNPKEWIFLAFFCTVLTCICNHNHRHIVYNRSSYSLWYRFKTKAM